MTTNKIVGACIFGSTLFLIDASGAALAQQPQQACAPADEMTTMLAERYGEALVFAGLSARGHAVTILLNPETGTFTALIVSPNGRACMVDAGSDGELMEYEAPAPAGSPS